MILLFELVSPQLDGTEFTMNLYAGEEVEPDPQVCNWLDLREHRAAKGTSSKVTQLAYYHFRSGPNISG